MKKNIMTKSLSLILSIVIIVTMVPVFAIGTSAETTIKNSDKITLGTYPQSKVTDSATLTKLKNASKTWVSYGYMANQNTPGDYMKYCDIDLDGDGSYDYRGVKFSKYRPDFATDAASMTVYTYQDDNGYNVNTEYYFAYDPLTWTVLDADTGLVMCDIIIDSQAYNNYYYGGYIDSAKTTNVNNWETSSIRSWLNDTFYNTAFSSADKTHIQLSTITNRGYDVIFNYEDTYIYDDTEDNIFLLSYFDMLNSDYGFSTSDSDNDTARRARGSDYAKSQGLCISTSSKDYGDSDWRLRSAGRNDSTCVVYSCGYVNYSHLTYSTDNGIRPAFYFNPESATSQSAEYTLGDVDGNGISVSDARLALRRAIGLENYAAGTAQFLACDVNFDGEVKVDDARLILRAAINLDDPKNWK